MEGGPLVFPSVISTDRDRSPIHDTSRLRRLRLEYLNSQDIFAFLASTSARTATHIDISRCDMDPSLALEISEKASPSWVSGFVAP